MSSHNEQPQVHKLPPQFFKRKIEYLMQGRIKFSCYEILLSMSSTFLFYIQFGHHAKHEYPQYGWIKQYTVVQGENERAYFHPKSVIHSLRPFFQLFYFLLFCHLLKKQCSTFRSDQYKCMISLC